MKYLLLLAPVVMAACDGPDRREAQNIANLVGRIRNDSSASPDDLKVAQCTQPEICQTRDACFKSLDATSKAIHLQREIELKLTDIEGGKMSKTSPEALALPKKLDDATRFNDEGHDALPLCDERLAAMKRKYRL